MTSFIWSNARSKIAYNTITQSVANGGLKLADLNTRIQVSLLKWVHRIYNEPDSFPAQFLQLLVTSRDVAATLLCKTKQVAKSLKGHSFYNSLMGVWRRLHFFPPDDEKEVRKEVLWNNSYITNGRGESLHWPRWEQAGIKTVHDMCHRSESRLLSHNEISSIYNLKCTFLEAMNLRMSIPLHWRGMISANFQGSIQAALEIKLPSQQVVSVSSVSAKTLYSELITTGRSIILPQRKWEASVDIRDQVEWAEIYTRAFRVCRETKMQAFQYRILHRTITCNHYLKRIRIKDEGTCSFCNSEDTLEHFLWACPISRAFWKEVFGWYTSASGLSLRALSLKEVLVGVPSQFPKAYWVNYILMHTKYFIHRQKLFYTGTMSIQHWTAELRKRLLTEKYVCRAEGKTGKFTKWQPLLEKTKQ